MRAAGGRGGDHNAVGRVCRTCRRLRSSAGEEHLTVLDCWRVLPAQVAGTIEHYLTLGKGGKPDTFRWRRA